jgi:hypothetical protein
MDVKKKKIYLPYKYILWNSAEMILPGKRTIFYIHIFMQIWTTIYKSSHHFTQHKHENNVLPTLVTSKYSIEEFVADHGGNDDILYRL